MTVPEMLSERHRPKKIEHLAGNRCVREALSSFVRSKELPHFLFFGPPGTGKTTAAKAICRSVLGEENNRALELNASDERGIDVVRDKIKAFAASHAISFTSAPSIKIVVLDEADSMTKDAQNALRRIMEIYSKNVRFIIICNYYTKIIPAIKSRCAPFRFSLIKPEEIEEYLEKVAVTENLLFEPGALREIAFCAVGDLRRAMNILESISMQGKVILSAAIACRREIEGSRVKGLYNALWEKEFGDIKKIFTYLRTDEGLDIRDIAAALAEMLKTDTRPGACSIMIDISQIEHRILSGCSEDMQENALISSFILNR